jgi:carbonic anhydrase
MKPLAMHQRNAVVINVHESLSKRLNTIDKKIDNIAIYLKNRKTLERSQVKPQETKTLERSQVKPQETKTLERSQVKPQETKTLERSQVKPQETNKTALIDAKVGRRVLFGSSVCAICMNLAKKKSKRSNYWDYETATGPDFWHNNGVCVPHASQSPINIIKDEVVKMQNIPQITFDYGEGDRGGTNVINTGHGTMQVNFEEGKYTAIVDGRTLNLVQFHFHTPSEHSINGQHAAMEVHLVHQDVNSGQLNVFGTLMNGTGQANAALQSCLEEAPYTSDISVSITVDPNTLLPPSSKMAYFNYSGSLTTPPCNEDVEWYVFENSIQCSSRQVINFQNYLKNGNILSMNARPIQPLNKREIRYGKI